MHIPDSEHQSLTGVSADNQQCIWQDRRNCDKRGFADSSLHKVLDFDMTALFLQNNPVQGKDKTGVLRVPSVWDICGTEEKLYSVSTEIHVFLVFSKRCFFSSLGASSKCKDL